MNKKTILSLIVLVLLTGCDNETVKEIELKSKSAWKTGKIVMAESAGDFQAYLLEDNEIETDKDLSKKRIRNPIRLGENVEHISTVSENPKNNDNDNEIETDKNMFSDWGEFKKWLKEEEPYGPN